MNITEADKARFWAKVDVREADDCWEWQAGLNTHGYGNFWLNGKHQGAHTLSYRIANGVDQTALKGLFVLHQCDTTSCCNPAHLRLGTHADNMQDKVDRNRQARGEKHGRAELNNAQVLSARKRSRAGESIRSIWADHPEISYSSLHRAIRGSAWKHLDHLEPPVPHMYTHKARAPRKEAA